MLYNIFIQARIGSTRLPGKVMKKILGKTVLELIIERLKKVQNINKIVIVTGTIEKNQKIIEEASRLNIDYFTGSEDNVLDRFYKASQKFYSDNIIRITADCPLIDFNLINKGLTIFDSNQYDILSIGRIRTFPHGFDFEIFKKTALQTAWEEKIKEFKDEIEFENTFIPPTKHMLEKKKFRNYDLLNDVDLSHIRLTLDYSEDFELITKIYESLYVNSKYFTSKEIMNLINENLSLLEINKKYAGSHNGLVIEK